MGRPRRPLRTTDITLRTDYIASQNNGSSNDGYNGSPQPGPDQSHAEQSIVPRPVAPIIPAIPGEDALRSIIAKGIQGIESGAIKIRAADIIKAVELLFRHGGAEADDYATAVYKAIEKGIPVDSPLGQTMPSSAADDYEDEEDDADADEESQEDDGIIVR